MIGDDIMRFGEKLRELRKQRALRQKDIAKELNIAQNTYSDYENDKVQPSFESLVKISNILQVPIDLLFFEDYENNHENISKAIGSYLNDRDRILTKLRNHDNEFNENTEHDVSEILLLMDYWCEVFEEDVSELKKMFEDRFGKKDYLK